MTELEKTTVAINTLLEAGLAVDDKLYEKYYELSQKFFQEKEKEKKESFKK